MPHRTPLNVEDARNRQLIRFMLRANSQFARLGRNPEVTLVVLAIRLGEIEGRRMDVSALANMVSLPRTTVIRHLNTLVASGEVDMFRSGRSVTPRLRSVESPSLRALFESFNKGVRTLCLELSKLDT